MKNFRLFAIAFAMIFATIQSYGQFEIPEKPSFQTSVYDYAKILSDTEKTELEEKLVRYSDSTSSQIVVITIDDLKGEDINVVSTNWAQKWGFGDKGKDNGVLLLVSMADRKMSIRPGYGVEDRLIAGVCGEIIRKIITPEFKNKNYFAGLDQGTDAIFEVLNGKFKGSRKSDEKGGIPILYIIIGVVIILYILSRGKNNGNNGGRSGGFDLADMIILSSLGRNSGGGFGGGSFGGSSGSGGFGGGFGGGGFSGGGASGGW